jgi:sugar lactone lactonase YvrE
VPLATPNNATIRRLSFNTQRLDTVLGYLLGDTYIYPVGPPPLARGLRGAGGVAADAEAGVVYFTEPGFNLVYSLALDHPTNAELWQVAPVTGTVTDCRRWGGYADGTLAEACFDWPTDIVFDATDRVLYVADSGNHVIRSIDVDGDVVQTLAGTPGVQGYGGDGGPANLAILSGPSGLAVYPAPATGLVYVYVADTDNHRVRRIDPDGTIQTVLGLGIPDAVGDGEPASDLPVERPYGLSLDAYGNLFVTSTRTIRVVAAGADNLAGPQDRVVTVYGGDAVDLRSQTAARCLSDVEVDPTSGSTVAYALDGCQGFFIELKRRFTLDAGGPEQ